MSIEKKSGQERAYFIFQLQHQYMNLLILSHVH